MYQVQERPKWQYWYDNFCSRYEPRYPGWESFGKTYYYDFTARIKAIEYGGYKKNYGYLYRVVPVRN